MDDSFVLVNAWDDAPPRKRGKARLTREGRYAEIGDRAARAMGHAGVSVTVTSVTDVTAFLQVVSLLLSFEPHTTFAANLCSKYALANLD